MDEQNVTIRGSAREVPLHSNRLLQSVLLAIFGLSLSRQDCLASWITLPEPPGQFRYEDICFVDPTIGRLVYYFGEFHRTSDGGFHWEKVAGTPEGVYRSVAFVTEERGWIGLIDSEFALLETSDGGSTWSYVELPAFVPGICGLYVIDDQTVVGCGVYHGSTRPGAAFIKTTNAGETWTAVDLSSVALSLVDCYFSSPDVGVVVGAVGPFASGQSVVFSTSNGGATWTKRYTGPRLGEHCWKVSFPSADVGYVSIQRSGHILKTTNGGTSWTELPSVEDIDQQGIGFINESTGWVGGWSGFTSKTTDGGLTWQSDPWGENVNSFYILSEGIAFASGVNAYRYDGPIIAVDDGFTADGGARLHRVLGNPFPDGTTIAYRVVHPSNVRLSILSPSGAELARLIDRPQLAGEYRATWSGTDGLGRPVPSGIYVLQLTVDRHSESGKLVLLR
jgi:photosystem II stability/assembly factor-like uncharacterized protein